MLGDELRRVRLERGLTQEELAFKAKISRNYVSLLELNEKSPTVETLQRVCAAMGVSAGELLLQVERAATGRPRRRR